MGLVAAVLGACRSDEPVGPPLEIRSARVLPREERAKYFQIRFNRPLPRANYYYTVYFRTKIGHTLREEGTLTTANHFFDPGPTYKKNVFLWDRRHDTKEKRTILEEELNAGNIESVVIQISTGYGYQNREKVAEAVFTDL